MANKGISDNIEEYLETLYRENSVGDAVSTTTLSKHLHVAPGSVTQMLKKLESLDYIVYIPYNGAHLTDSGLKIAQKIIRKHRILEIFLEDVLNISHDDVHLQACEMEHSLSDEAERALCHMLSQPDICPSGNIVPACDFKFSTCEECVHSSFDIDHAKRYEFSLLAITQLKEGKGGTVTFIRGLDSESKVVKDAGINIGDKITVIGLNRSNDYLIIAVNGKEIPIKRSIANKVFLDTHL
ncbi:metal-dependent transcriptional regulator [uncultured Methanobrevibacter sp.]|uniref:metal-dependent transcriptional regulator n=1 Tax=uncultured Methanobrevibacter sp. TaxID=253161 RepID=UPI0025E5BF33|nr:metal-dependent transcriptional regulator [uncultured Methanobrevibacter sp.]